LRAGRRYGTEIWRKAPDPAEFIAKFSRQVAARNFAFSPQGYALASETRLYLPTGRTSRQLWTAPRARSWGCLSVRWARRRVRALGGDTLMSGPGTQLTAFDARRATDRRVSGLRLIVAGPNAYVVSEQTIAALDRARYVEVVNERERLNARAKELRGGPKKRGKRKAQRSPRKAFRRLIREG